MKAPKVKTIRPTVSFCRRLLGTHLHHTCYVIAIMRKLRPKSNCCSLNRSHLRLRRLWRRPRFQFRIRLQFQLRGNLFPIRKAPIPHQKKPIPIPVPIRKAPVASQEVQKANWSRTTLVAWRSPLGNRRLSPRQPRNPTSPLCPCFWQRGWFNKSLFWASWAATAWWFHEGLHDLKRFKKCLARNRID